MEKPFGKQIKTIEDQWKKKQIEALKDLKPKEQTKPIEDKSNEVINRYRKWRKYKK